MARLCWRLRALWTPGHAQGHLSFYEERTGTLLTGDCVVGFGTVVIAPPEGNMVDYLASLRRYLSLPRLTALMPGHGPVIANARERIEEYLAHRVEREAQIVTILCDYGNRYQSKLFNPDFLRSKSLPVPTWLEKRSTFDLPFETV